MVSGALRIGITVTCVRLKFKFHCCCRDTPPVVLGTNLIWITSFVIRIRCCAWYSVQHIRTHYYGTVTKIGSSSGSRVNGDDFDWDIKYEFCGGILWCTNLSKQANSNRSVGMPIISDGHWTSISSMPKQYANPRGTKHTFNCILSWTEKHSELLHCSIL